MANQADAIAAVWLRRAKGIVADEMSGGETLWQWICAFGFSNE